MFLFSADSFKIDLLKNSLVNANKASNSLDTNQAQRSGSKLLCKKVISRQKSSPRQMCSHVFLSQFVKTLVSEKPKERLEI